MDERSMCLKFFSLNRQRQLQKARLSRKVATEPSPYTCYDAIGKKKIFCCGQKSRRERPEREKKRSVGMAKGSPTCLGDRQEEPRSARQGQHNAPRGSTRVLSRSTQIVQYHLRTQVTLSHQQLLGRLQIETDPNNCAGSIDQQQFCLSNRKNLKQTAENLSHDMKTKTCVDYKQLICSPVSHLPPGRKPCIVGQLHIVMPRQQCL